MVSDRPRVRHDWEPGGRSPWACPGGMSQLCDEIQDKLWMIGLHIFTKAQTLFEPHGNSSSKLGLSGECLN